MRFWKDIAGVAAVEFALIAPALVFLLIGVVDYGMYMNATMKLENTARTAAAYLYEGGDEDNLAEDVFLPGNLGLTEDTVDELASRISYICECVDGDAVDCDLGCGEYEEDVDSDDDDEEDIYMRRYLEVTLSMDHQALISYPGIPRTMTLASFVRLQME